MAEKIEWLENMDEALNQAKLEEKPILLDFFNPGESGANRWMRLRIQTPREDFVAKSVVLCGSAY